MEYYLNILDRKEKLYMTEPAKTTHKKFRHSEGFKPESVPQALKVIQGKLSNERMGDLLVNKNVQSQIKNQVGGVFIPVKNIKQAREWYCKLLGVPVEGEIQFGHLYTLPMDGAGVILDEMPMWGGKERGGAPTYQTPAFMFQTDDIHDAYHFMKNLGANLVTEVNDNHWFAFRDPDGNLLMMCQ
jgi:catechol 2,3-dioxygenase-like lactoylglutathione lyase family enzyme